VLLVVAAAWAVGDRHPGWGFGATSAAIGVVVASFFVGLYPNLIVSTTNKSYNITGSAAASGTYTLNVMTLPPGPREAQVRVAMTSRSIAC
jgi:cytochrome d ubiquinol oxidase subunit II